MIVKRLVLGELQANGYLVACEETKAAVMIDPGGDGEAIRNALDEDSLKLTLIVNTHAHFDHIGANRYLAELYQVSLGLHQLELPVLRAKGGAFLFGLDIPQSPEPERFLGDGEKILFGNCELTAIHTPGHSPGHLCFYSREDKILFSGDLLFASGIGRTDLPGGDGSALAQSMKQKIFTLPDDTTVFPGHGPETTVGKEKKTNPFLRG